MFDEVLREWGAEEVTAMEVYSDIFSLGDGLIQREGEEVETRNRKSNPLGYWKDSHTQKGHYRIMFDDTFEDSLRELQEADFSILNGVTYFGRKNLQASANKMYALIFDLDGVTDSTLNNFMSGAIRAEAYPVPNYIALSGHGVHLYYVFEDPVPLYPNIKIQLKSLKYALTEKIWNSYTSKDKKIQYQGINQGFRPIGGKTKIEGVRVRAFRVNDHPFSLSQLCDYVLPEYRIDESKLYRESTMTLDQAQKKYPEWYQKRVMNKDQTRGHWTCKRDLYDWWKRQIRSGATYHHRYFNIMCLAIYAVKSGISEEELRSDAMELIPFMNDIYPEESFTETDVESALECYDERYCTFPIEDISKLSGIQIQKNKRNYQRQKDHLEEARAIRDIRSRRRGEVWDAHNGRKSQAEKVIQWRSDHPEGKKADCIRETGLSKSTVYRHWEKT